MSERIPSTTDRQLVKNSIYSTAASFASVVVGIFVVPFIVKKLGTEQYGLYALLTGMVGYCAILDLGLGEGIVKFVAEYKAQNNTPGIHKSINTALLLQIILGFIGSLSLCIFSHPIMHILKVPSTYTTEFIRSLYLVAFGFFFTMIAGSFGSVLRGLQRYDTISRYSIALNLSLNIISVIALYGFSAHLQTLICINLLFALLTFFVALFAVKRELPDYKISFIIDAGYLKRIFNFSGFMFISRISSVFSSSIVQFVISGFLGPAAVTYYAIPSKLIGAAGSLLSSASTVVFPYASELSTRNNMEKVKTLFLHGSRLFASFSVPGFLLLAVFSKPVLHVWMGPEFAEKGWLVMSLLSFSSLLGALTTIPNFITLGLGHARLISLFTIVTVLFYSVLLPVFTKTFGMNGAAIAMMCSQLPGIVLIFYEAVQIMKIRISDFVSEVFSFHLIPIAVSIVLLFFVAHNICFLDIRIGLPTLALYCLLYGGGLYVSKWFPFNEYLLRVRG